MNPMDTLIWLVNFPASHGYAMVFIAGFSILGLFALSARGAVPGGALRAVREREGLLPLDARPRGRVWGSFVRVGARILAFLMLGSLVIGILSLTGVPVTRAYIYDNGRPTSATMQGDWVTFTTAEGVEYTLESNFFTPAVYPDRDAYIPGGELIVVRYLPSHPQAFVIDSDQTPR
ncbi:MULTISPECIES: hypothetical protein [unclassified Microbacterium]|uniref:hypothetical protein n=1 Tax=unclassified Microbacterium TaxID=2609290 RepID=UPI000CFB7A83|nr:MULTISPECIES: hypothetical protein [unclassified Microbacterium]PQZ60581.1 hypothetical protein CQ032_03465 [Microbacterium sp. MYb43]PQZ82007.1 hypothetical protein CQ031_00865 [Microbacterium sp. MYb40]PRB22270.1 hypothetical protein CQ040_06440 [Microbacterium sp. MYb54]PRB31165.1 hypothetical protein CQ037_03590 [Microbacterium sp. MYb50]PRB69774.1 hypothetical protein CQ021_03370 [Microbacterium sp. MYb24]